MRILGWLCASAIGSITSAEPCTLSWEVSPDNGTTWAAGVVSVPQAQTSVLVRLRASFDLPQGYYFARAEFDGVVEGLAGAGLADSTSVFRSRNQSFMIPRNAGVRLGSLLKLEQGSDGAAPGLGNAWASIYQQQNGLGTPFAFGSPVTILDFTLNLDGSLGRRDIYGVFRPIPAGQPSAGQPWVYLGLPQSTDIAPAQTTFVNTSVIVVPTPGGVGVIVLAGLATLRRRR